MAKPGSASDAYLVRDVMTASPTTISHEASLIEAVLTLRSTGFRHLPIVEKERLVGLITDRDIHRLAPSMLIKITPEEYNAIFEKTSLERVMTRDPMTISPDTPIREAANIIREKKLGCLPVVEGGRLVGILTKSDILRFLVALLDGAAVPSATVPGR